MDELTIEQMADEALKEAHAGLTRPMEELTGHVKKLSGAQKRREWLSRVRTQDKHGVWRLLNDETLYPGIRGKVRS